MGTRSAIGIKNSDGSVTAIYCHWDGYPSYNGRILKDHYGDESKVRELIGLGDISSLKQEIGEQHPFHTYHLKEEDKDPRWENWTTAYGRDRDEIDCEAETYVSDADFVNRFSRGTEYYYLFDNGTWNIRPENTKAVWRPVADYLEEEKEVE